MKIDTLTKVEWFIRVRTFYGKVMNLDVFILATYILLDQPHLNAIAKKTKGKQYDMGCECGKGKVDAHAEQDCELSAKLEESGPIDHDKYHRIVGGCNAGHTPWYTLFILTENNVKCGGALINKFWILSAAHCFCNEDYMSCHKVKNKWVPDYDIKKIKVPLLSILESEIVNVVFRFSLEQTTSQSSRTISFLKDHRYSGPTVFIQPK